MEEAPKDQSSVSGTKGGGGSAKLLRYPLRSATKPKDDKPPLATPTTASASRRGRPSSSVSQSVSALDLSAKEKSAKPPRRLSIPNKSTASPAPKPAGNVTPISEARANRSGNIKGKNETPVSDASKSLNLNRRKFSVLSSASYWISQIKVSEAAAKHQVSLGFFKLALEAGCENLQPLRDELKSYARRHNLLEFGESAKEVFQSYDISESIDQLQVSETCSHVPEDGVRSSDEDARSSSSVTASRKLKPRSLINSASSAARESAKETTQKTNPVSRTRASANKKIATQSPPSEVGRRNMQKSSQKASKQEPSKAKQMVKNEGKKSTKEEDPVNPSPQEAILEENKENMDAPPMEDVSLEA